MAPPEFPDVPVALRQRNARGGSGLSRAILIGSAAGVATGLLLGDLVAPLAVVAQGYVGLLQMTVLPFVTVSIVQGLGGLEPASARRLGLRAGAVVAALWSVGLLYAFLVPFAFPPSERAAFFSAALVEQPPPFDFVGVYIPANPFQALAGGIVPAVVLFSIAVGVAVMGIERKAVLLDVLAVVGDALSKVTRVVVHVTPLGLFAVVATAVGTMRFEELRQVEVFVIPYVAMALVVALWVLPGLVAAMTTVPYRAVLGPARGALITAFSVGDLFIVLPVLIECSRELLIRHRVVDYRQALLPDVIVPASFNFPHAGKLLSLSFVLFSGWFADTPVPIGDYARLASTGLLACFGSLNAAIPFLLDTFRIPADTLQLFLATGVVNARVGSLVAAVHTLAVSLLGSAAIAGTLRVEPRRLAIFLGTTVVLTAVVLGALNLAFRTWLRQDFPGSEVVYGMTNAIVRDAAHVVDGTSWPEGAAATVAGMRHRGTMRVAFASPRLPFAFRNAGGVLVGFDVEVAHLLAADLGVRAEFVEVPAGRLMATVAAGAADTAIGGIVLTPEAAALTRFSTPYLDETLAFVVRDHLRRRFETWEAARRASDLRIGVPAVPHYQRLLAARLPGLTIAAIAPGADPLDPRLGLDAVALPAERGSVLTLLDPRWTVVVPSPGVIKVPLALPLGGRDPAWPAFVDAWIEVRRRDGTLDALYTHWILGRAATAPSPRWSVVRDVLHWVE